MRRFGKPVKDRGETPVTAGTSSAGGCCEPRRCLLGYRWAELVYEPCGQWRDDRRTVPPSVVAADLFQFAIFVFVDDFGRRCDDIADGCADFDVQCGLSLLGADCAAGDGPEMQVVAVGCFGDQRHRCWVSRGQFAPVIGADGSVEVDDEEVG